MLINGKLRIDYLDKGIGMSWNNSPITENVHFNVGLNTLGLWTDSSKAHWQIMDQGEDYLKVKVIFQELPLSQNWLIKLEGDHQIYWKIDLEIEEHLHIDEFRMVCGVNRKYKTWINSFQEKVFPRLNQYWQDLCLDNVFTSFVGVRFPTGNTLLPSLVFESCDDSRVFSPLVQNTPLDINTHIIGFRKINHEDERDYPPGCYQLFAGRIKLYEDNYLLDKKIEDVRQDYFKSTMKRVSAISEAKELKVMLVNLPWQNNGVGGVRAGSRWPHMKDLSEGNYLPFPFFLAYATSLLEKNGIKADLVDAIAECLSEDKFIERLLGANCNVLVVETSVPSFYHDLQLLRKLSNFGFTIILCGPNSEIYKFEFLKENRFINYVLFGEYEFTLLELTKIISKGKKDLTFVKGLIWRDEKGNIIKNHPREPFDINCLPWPHRDKLPMEKYWDLPGDIPHPSVQIVASRGCPFGCSFCLWPQILFGGKTYRVRDVTDCIDEMEYLVREKGFKSVYFDDDTFNVGKARMLDFCNEIIKRKLDNVPWAIMAKADLMDEEILDKMKEAGLHAVKYGVESASQELVDRCGKCLDLKKAEQMIKYSQHLGIKVHLTFSFGLPGETKETIKKTVDYALKLDPQSVQFSIITPFPGTTLFEELDKKEKILTKNWSLYDGHYSCVFQPDNLSLGDLEESKQHAYRLWLDYQRKKRGLLGDLKRFYNYAQKDGLGNAVKKTKDYLNYSIFHRKKFIGKI
ncbi:MAG: radical SAM protein [Candidatus Omnitrophica bacterium]|nr:radical SAM protein [Candidatus Omnitrophota bacterium]